MLCNLILTQIEEIWKTTSIFLNERQPQVFENGRRPQFFENEGDINPIQMKNDLNIIANGSQYQKITLQPKTIKIKTMVVALLRII